MSAPISREWVGLQQFPAATQTKLPNLLGKLKEEEALQQLASADLIDLCNEVKIEHCRATRDLRSCGREVQYVLTSCGHASLCAECSQRCDVCPICRTPLVTAERGQRVRQRLYYKCVEAGLVHEEKNSSNSVGKDGHMNVVGEDGQRLFSLFDVALQNNLVSMICHYITDVCLDENAVSSDPVRAFLLDEVAIKGWCKQTVLRLISQIVKIYKLEIKAMKDQLSELQNISIQLGGVCDVVHVMVSSFREAFSAEIGDLHQLYEDILKAKQHLEVTIWGIRHEFLSHVESRYTSFESWKRHVIERKAAAAERPCQEFSLENSKSGGELFIQQALQNLDIDKQYGEKNKEIDIYSLQDEKSSRLLSSSDNEYFENWYPFENLRVAIDVLFLHGTSEMVVSKQAILLYYLYDRHWTKPENEWMHLVDDFAATFGISRKILMECKVFYLLDGYSSQAQEAAVLLLPKIASKETHPKISQVLLKHHQTDVALNVLRCSGHDSFSGATNTEDDNMSFLRDALTAVRVRISHGLLTEAFMYQRNCCSKIKEDSQHLAPLSSTKCSWSNFMDILVSEICNICIQENIVDRMIELPWNTEEEKYIHKCLFEYASRMPSTIFGSLLVVFYLQRCRYAEAFEVHRRLQNFELSAFNSASEDKASKVHTIAQWRQSLIDKCLELLPLIERDRLISGKPSEQLHYAAQETLMPPSARTVDVSNFVAQVSPQKNNSPLLNFRKPDVSTPSSGPLGSYPVRSKKVPYTLQEFQDGHFGTPVLPERRRFINEAMSPIFQRSKIPNNQQISKLGHGVPASYNNPLDKSLHLGSVATPAKDTRTTWKLSEMNELNTSHKQNPLSSDGFILNVQQSHHVALNGGFINCENTRINKDELGGSCNQAEEFIHHSTKRPQSLKKRETVGEDEMLNAGFRWRSDDSSDDDDPQVMANMEVSMTLAGRRQARFLRR